MGGLRKHSKTWKVTKKKKQGTDGGSNPGGSNVGRPINNLTGVGRSTQFVESVIPDPAVMDSSTVDRAVWGLGQNVWLG